MDFSVLIIVKNRHDHLLECLAGIGRSQRQPKEVVIVHMNEPTVELSSSLPIAQYSLQSDHTLPLAEARNYAANKATTDNLVFLDVDCIPASDCFDQLLGDLAQGSLVMADPRYLPTLQPPLDPTALAAVARPNPARKQLSYGLSDRYELFWSLGFAITKSDFARVGGFDTSYTGYGGEDTDFAFRAKAAGVTLYYSRAQVYHQNHPSYDPPLNWLEDIVVNARHFKSVWGAWPMTGWLSKFQELGFITWDETNIAILRVPTEADIAAAKKPDAL